MRRPAERNEKKSTQISSGSAVSRCAAVLLAALVAVSTAACGGQSASGTKTDARRADAGEGSSTAEAVPAGQQEGASAAGTASAEQTAQPAEDIEIPEEPYVRDDGGVSMNVFAMDTYMTLLAYGESSDGDEDGTAQAERAVRAAAEEIHSLDEMLSTGNPDSEISKLNAAGGGSASDVVIKLIRRSQQLRRETGGLFEIAIYPVMKLWGFPTQDYHVPEKEDLDKALKLADASAITIGQAGTEAKDAKKAVSADTAGTAAGTAAAETGAAGRAGTAAGTKAEASGAAVSAVPAAGAEAAASGASKGSDTTVSFGIPGMEIDLGGIAKGYTSSRVMEIFKEQGIKHGLVSLGGNVQALGSKADGKPWRVAIQNPESDLDYLGILDIEGKCVITSGGYERFFIEDGVRYHHIIDPRTGYPADSGLLSATIISEDGTLADGLSTSLFIMGKEEAEKYWRAHPGTFDYILEDTDGTLYVTKGAAGLLTTEAKTVVVQ